VVYCSQKIQKPLGHKAFSPLSLSPSKSASTHLQTTSQDLEGEISPSPLLPSLPYFSLHSSFICPTLKGVSQLRKDPFSSAWVIISPERGLEPSDFGSAKPKTNHSPLSPGNEAFVGKEIRSLCPPGSKQWRMRVIENPTALLIPKPFQISGSDLFTSALNSGYQEIIVEHPDASMTLDHMPLEHLTDVLKLYRDRLETLSGKPDIHHIQLTRNVGKMAGASYDHPHAQILAIPVNNRWIDEEISAANDYHDLHGHCLFCDVMDAELRTKERLISYNQHFVAIAPYASKNPLETWILPRQHGSSFSEIASNVLPFLAELLQSIVRAMNSALNYPPYNLLLHTLPKEGNNKYHWHIELLPRLTRQAGFDWSSGFYVNPTPPEDAARFLKGALALQEV
jgi:UDPglucose--hexose-1-phosphate uridylyltransferase